MLDKLTFHYSDNCTLFVLIVFILLTPLSLSLIWIQKRKAHRTLKRLCSLFECSEYSDRTATPNWIQNYQTPWTVQKVPLTYLVDLGVNCVFMVFLSCWQELIIQCTYNMDKTIVYRKWIGNFKSFCQIFGSRWGLFTSISFSVNNF